MRSIYSQITSTPFVSFFFQQKRLAATCARGPIGQAWVFVFNGNSDITYLRTSPSSARARGQFPSSPMARAVVRWEPEATHVKLKNADVARIVFVSSTGNIIPKLNRFTKSKIR